MPGVSLWRIAAGSEWEFYFLQDRGVDAAVAGFRFGSPIPIRPRIGAKPQGYV